MGAAEAALRPRRRELLLRGLLSKRESNVAHGMLVATYSKERRFLSFIEERTFNASPMNTVILEFVLQTLLDLKNNWFVLRRVKFSKWMQLAIFFGVGSLIF